MNNTTQSIVTIIVLSVLGAILKHYFGVEGKIVLVGILVLASISLSVIYSKQKKWLREKTQGMSPAEQSEYEAECKKEGIDNPYEFVDETELSWTGKAIDALLGITAAFGPPITYHLIKRLPLSWESNVSVWHILCMGIGIITYSVFRNRILAQYMVKTEQSTGE